MPPTPIRYGSFWEGCIETLLEVFWQIVILTAHTLAAQSKASGIALCFGTEGAIAAACFSTECPSSDISHLVPRTQQLWVRMTQYVPNECLKVDIKAYTCAAPNQPPTTNPAPGWKAQAVTEAVRLNPLDLLIERTEADACGARVRACPVTTGASSSTQPTSTQAEATDRQQV